MIVHLVRHAKSRFQTNEEDPQQVPDSQISLADDGIQQARETGLRIGGRFLANALLYASPYLRARQTLAHALDASRAFEFLDAATNQSLRIYIDPRLREMEWGVLKSREEVEREELLRDRFGWSYYRMSGGESPLDVYDRVTTFIDSLLRQAKQKRRKRAVIVSHGVTIRVLVMRWLYLTPEQYNSIHNPDNCDVITLAPLHTKMFRHVRPQFRTSRWGVWGLRLRDEAGATALAGEPGSWSPGCAPTAGDNELRVGGPARW